MTTPPFDRREALVRASPAIVLAACWAACLATLLFLWARARTTGPGPLFLVWTVAAAPLGVWSWLRLDQWGGRSLRRPRGAPGLVLVAAAWVAAGWIAVQSRVPAALAGEERVAVPPPGGVVFWYPGVFGVAVCLLGALTLSVAALRLARGRVEPTAPGEPPPAAPERSAD